MASHGRLQRVLRHLFIPDWVAKRPFTRDVLLRIKDAVHASEARHDGELRVVVEASLPLAPVLRGLSARHRAHDVFAQQRVWDTEHDCGVLIYLQLIDRRVEIVADRGIARRVEQHEWDAICRGMESAFREGAYQQGVLAAIGTITALLARHFPRRGNHPNELPDAPTVL